MWRRRRRRKILDAAARLFSKAAYDAVQMSDVARAAGLAKPTLYRYFPSKEELFLEVSNELLERLDDRLRRAMSARVRPHEILKGMVRMLIEELAGQTAPLRMLTGETSAPERRWRRLFHAHQRAITGALRQVLEAGIRDGEFRPLDLEVVPRLILNVVRSMPLGGSEASEARVAHAVVDFVVYGTAAGKLASSATSKQRMRWRDSNKARPRGARPARGRSSTPR
jgi:AcrR family transcriptional regulator